MMFRLSIGLGLSFATFCALAQVPNTPAPTQNPVLPVGPTPGNLFSMDERGAIVTYWSAPGRYTVSTPDDASTKGLWQVRETVDGSTWLWNYNKIRRLSAPPTANPVPTDPQQITWEDWIKKKLAHDRWEALIKARAANKKLFGIDAPAPDKNATLDEPTPPGPIPPDMLAAFGDPPALAQATVPMQYKVNFDEGPVQYLDNVRLGSPRYAYYRFTDGVMSGGQAVKDIPSDTLDRLFKLAGSSDFQSHVMRAVSPLEGGFDSINTYDTGFVSVGFIQFASLKEGGGSLGTLLNLFKTDNPTAFNNCFRKYGIDVANGILDVVDPSTGAEVFGPDANTRIIEDKRLIAVFQHAGLYSDEFRAEQIKSALAQFFPADDPVSLQMPGGTTIAGKVSDFVKSEACMATLFDRKVNTGGLRDLPNVLTQIASAHHCASCADFANYEADIMRAMKYRADFSKDQTLTQPATTTGAG